MPDFATHNELLPEEIIRLRAALESIDFNVTQEETEGKYVLDRFAEMLALLSREERALILTLVEDFLHCSFLKQWPLLREALNAIPEDLVSGASKIILLPLAETGDDGKPKSPSGLIYPTANYLLPFMPKFTGIRVIPYDKLARLKSKQSFRRDSLIVLLDDFIGSGGTAVKTIRRYRRDLMKRDDRLVIVVVAAQQQGIDLIAKENVPTFAARTRLKGITESTVINERPAALAIMDRLEKRLGVQAGYLRGYGGCEALVKMTRTPNNTFPIFWHPTTASGEAWPAPFRRF